MHLAGDTEYAVATLLIHPENRRRSRSHGGSASTSRRGQRGAVLPARPRSLGSSLATVAEVMNTNVLTVDPTASIGEAAEKMIEAGVGAVVVMEDMARIVGIVTERDLMRAVAQRARAAEAQRAAVDDGERRHDRAGHRPSRTRRR